ncbi:histidine phosphotransferase family protein [Streptomyces sp. NPDC048290]|uniref:histidine phosphotransferase family protein n=1 Tax=Streptomyces sp. NPDC048290 TaxID=3155811 RepID=UPI00343E04A1
MLGTFPDGFCQGTADSGVPQIDAGRTTLTLTLTCATTAWPAGGKVTVGAEGSVGLVLSGAFDSVDVVATLGEGYDGRLTAAVRPRRADAFADALDRPSRHSMIRPIVIAHGRT